MPAWMWGDPAEVVERLELQAAAKLERQRKVRSRPEEQGLSPVTVRTQRRLRIRESMADVLKGRK